jgi:DNA (cytosine-5)-methyltransferase 1
MMYAAIHASPPCQTFTRAGHLRDAQGKTTDKLDLVEPTRAALRATGLPYVIENVPGAPLNNPVQLCGSSFGLKVRRHRLFETNFYIPPVACDHKKQGRPVGLYGSMKDNIPNGGRTAHSIEEAREAMGIDWMQWRSVNQEWNDLKEAIPPLYTEYVGEHLMEAVLLHRSNEIADAGY